MSVRKSMKKGILDIKEGRHPVVERMIPNDMFIANDTYLDDKKHRISIITGPNMAGKSTLHASDCIDRTDGSDRIICPGREREHLSFRPYFHQSRSIR